MNEANIVDSEGVGEGLPRLINDYVKALAEVLNTLNVVHVDRLVKRLIQLREEGKTLYLCGNGGSAANAIHLANDFTFGVDPSGRSLNVEALAANSSILTCLGNDIGYENIFSHQIKVKGQPGDVLLVLSGSGNSDNILRALAEAKSQDMDTVAILGYQGGEAKGMANHVFHFEIDDMQIAEDAQVVLGHILMKALYKEFKHDTK